DAADEEAGERGDHRADEVDGVSSHALDCIDVSSSRADHLAQAGLSLPEAGGSRPRPATLDDRTLRWIGIPGFGLVIPQATDLYRPHRPDGLIFWLATVWFVLLAWSIWHTNRWLLFKQREHADWFEHPWRKIVLLLVGVVFGTLPVTVVSLLVWYKLGGFAAP